MRPTITYPMAGLSPSNVHTLAACVRMRYSQALRRAIQCAREGDAGETSCSYWIGMAEGQVNVLYDINTSDAYSKLKRCESVLRIVLEQRRQRRQAACAQACAELHR